MIKESISADNAAKELYNDRSGLLLKLLDDEKVDYSKVGLLNWAKNWILDLHKSEQKKSILKRIFEDHSFSSYNNTYYFNIFAFVDGKGKKVACIVFDVDEHQNKMAVYERSYYDKLKRVAEGLGLDEISKSWKPEPGERLTPKQEPKRTVLRETEDLRPRYERGGD
jgi:hypothetical protein